MHEIPHRSVVCAGPLPDDLKRRKSKTKYSVQFKLSTVQFIEETGTSYLVLWCTLKVNR